MASPTNSQPCSGGPLCLPLLKFSYATVPMDSAAPVPWTHLASKNNLFAMFETARTRNLEGQVEERKMFKVLRDPEVMEELDLEVLAREAQQAIAVSKDAHQHNRDQNVAVIVKVPVIAMKYPMAGGQVRRFQIRFASDETYYDAMKMLSRAQVPTIEAGTFPNRPHTATFSSATNNADHQKPASIQLNSRPVTAAPALGNPGQASHPLTNLQQISEAVQKPATTIMPPPSHFSSPTKPDALSKQRNMPQSGNQGAYSIGNGVPLCGQASITGQAENENPQPLSIDLYTARPSAAPLRTSQHLSQLLPARRELPFEKPKPVSAMVSTRVLRSTTKDSPESETTSSTKQGVVEKPKKILARKTASKASQSSTKKRKRNSAPPKENDEGHDSSPAKKGCNNRIRTSKLPRDDAPVPGIEGLPRSHGAGTTTSEQGNGKTDTQALLSRAEKLHDSRPPVLTNEANLAAVKSSCEQLSLGLDIPAVSLVEFSSSYSALPSASPSKVPTTIPPCTPANKMIKPSTPSAPFAQHTVDTAPDPAFDADAFPALTNAYACLLKHPAFANSDEKISAWAALPEDKQREALRMYMCEQYASPMAADGFLQLCKVLETTWEGIVVWPGVYKGVI